MMAKTLRHIGAWLCILAIVALGVTGCGDSSSSRRDGDDDDNRDPVPTVPSEPSEPSDASPEGNSYELVDLSQYPILPDTVTRVYEETIGAGYVVELTTNGFKTNMVIQCGISANGTVIDAKCISSNETLGYEKTYGDNFKDKDAAGVDAVDTISGATMTTTAYKNAVKDAIKTAKFLNINEEIDISAYANRLPSSVTQVFKGNNDYVIYLNVIGYNHMTIACGITFDGVIWDALCISSNETLGIEKTYGENFKGKDLAGVDTVDIISGATFTTQAYKGAVKDAVNTVLVLSGGGVDLRTPEQILQDNLNAALPVGKGKFTKLFITEVVEGVDAIYAADNGKGYVAVIGEEFVGVTATGNSHNSVAATAVKVLMASTSTDVDLSAYENLNPHITSVKKTTTGNYVMEVKGEGYGIHGEYNTSNEYILIRVSISAEGKIIDCLTVSHKESTGIGSACDKESFYSQFDGKTADTYTEVDGIAGATITTHGYLTAIKHCFEAVAILEEGAES